MTVRNLMVTKPFHYLGTRKSFVKYTVDNDLNTDLNTAKEINAGTDELKYDNTISAAKRKIVT